MDTYCGHLEHAVVLAFGLLFQLHSSDDNSDDGRPISAGEERLESAFKAALDFGSGESSADPYGVSLGERKTSQIQRTSPEDPAREKEPSSLVSWLYLVRYAVSVQVRDYRADLTLLHPPAVNLANATVLGSGSTFIVRRWTRDRGDPDLAIKTIRRCTPAEEDDILAAVRVEMKALTHPSLVGNEFIVQLEAVDWEVRAGYRHPLPILLTEYAEFGDLAGYQRRLLTLRFEAKLQLCLDVALGIRSLHAHGFIHGDIKSENVLLFRHPHREFIAKLSDFAFSILPSQRGEKRRLPGKSFPYNAPEIDGDKETAALDFKGLSCADVYSFGMLVWRTMLDGRNPFSVGTSSQKSVPLHSINEIIRRKQDEKLIEEACGSIKHSAKDIKIDVVREVLQATLQVQPEERDIVPAIFAMAGACGQTERHYVAQLSYLRLQYRPPRRQTLNSYQQPDYLVFAAMESDPCISMPTFLSFHPVDKMHAVVQQHILLALEEIATGQSDASIIIKLFLVFVYLCGFGHASRPDNWEKIATYCKEAVQDTIQKLLTEGSDEDKAKAVVFTITGRRWDLLPLQDASTFFFQMLNTLTNGEEARNLLPYEGGLIENAQDGSPIARRLLQKYLPTVCEDMKDRAYSDELEEQHKDLLSFRSYASKGLESVIKRNSDVTLDLLAYHYPGLDKVTFEGNTYLHLAAEHGYTLVVQDLLDQILDVEFVNLCNPMGETPLFLAAKGGHLDVCRILLQAGAEVKENLFDETPLHWVSAFSDEDEIEFLIGEFVARGGDIARYAGRISTLAMDTHAKAGTPLERAVSRNNPVAVKSILKVGQNAELLVTDKALHTAAKYHFSECLQILLDAKPMVDSIINHRNLLGNAILGAPKWQWYHWHGLSHQQAATDTLEILLDAGVDTTKVVTYIPFSQRFEAQLSAMGAAALVGADYMIHLLASRGVSVEAQSTQSEYERESPPLYEALSRGYYDAARALLSHGADPNVRWLMIGGNTYLHLCAYYHWGLDFAKLLVEEHSADIDIVDNRGRTPLYTALLAENFAFVDYLLERGASATGWPATMNIEDILFNLFGELLLPGGNISNQQLEYALKISGGGFQVVPHAGLQATALHIACWSHLLSEDGRKGFTPLSDAYSLMEERRIVEFVLSKFPSSTDINAKTSDGDTALQFAAASGHIEAVKTLLETGAVDGSSISRSFNILMAFLSAPLPDDVLAAGHKLKYTERIKDMLRLLRPHLPQDRLLKLPVNAYTKRPAALPHLQGAESLPAREQYICARRYCSLPIYPAVCSFFPTQHKPADIESYVSYARALIEGLSPIMVETWGMGNMPIEYKPTEDMLWGVRHVLWQILDIDWVLFVKDADGIHFRSPSERLEMLECSLRQLLGWVFDVKLKLAGNRQRMELLFLVKRKGETDDRGEGWENMVCTWMPPFEEGRDAAQLAEWEDFLDDVRVQNECFRHGLTVATEAEEPDEAWNKEVQRIRNIEK